MSKLNLKLFIEDILQSIEAIESYITDVNSFRDFLADRKTYSATIREYIIIGEAISPLIELLESKFPDYEWRMIKLLKVVIHEAKEGGRWTEALMSVPESCREIDP